MSTMRLEAFLEAAIAMLNRLANYRVLNDDEESDILLERHLGSRNMLAPLNDCVRDIRELFAEENATALEQWDSERQSLAMKAHTLFRQLSYRFAQYLIILSGIDDAGQRDEVPPKNAKAAFNDACMTIADMADEIGVGEPIESNLTSFSQDDLAILAQHFITQPGSEFAGMDPSAVAGWLVSDTLADPYIQRTGYGLSGAVEKCRRLIQVLFGDFAEANAALTEAKICTEQLHSLLTTAASLNEALIQLSKTSEVRKQPEDLAKRFQSLVVEVE